MTDRRWFAIAVLLGGLLSGGAGADNVYKWVDAQGHMHFGSAPPAGARAERLSTPPSEAQPAKPAAASSWQEQMHVSSERKQLAREKDQEAAKRQQDDYRRCLAARGALDTLNRERPIYRVNSAGEREYWDDSQRQSARDSANQRVATYCHN
jgi:hypothetical protein